MTNTCLIGTAWHGGIDRHPRDWGFANRKRNLGGREIRMVGFGHRLRRWANFDKRPGLIANRDRLESAITRREVFAASSGFP